MGFFSIVGIPLFQALVDLFKGAQVGVASIYVLAEYAACFLTLQHVAPGMSAPEYLCSSPYIALIKDLPSLGR